MGLALTDRGQTDRARSDDPERLSAGGVGINYLVTRRRRRQSAGEIGLHFALFAVATVGALAFNRARLRQASTDPVQ